MENIIICHEEIKISIKKYSSLNGKVFVVDLWIKHTFVPIVRFPVSYEL